MDLCKIYNKRTLFKQEPGTINFSCKSHSRWLRVRTNDPKFAIFTQANSYASTTATDKKSQLALKFQSTAWAKLIVSKNVGCIFIYFLWFISRICKCYKKQKST